MRPDKSADNVRRPVFRTVYSKLLTIYISVIIATMALLGFLLGRLFRNLYLNDLRDTMLRECVHIVSDLMPNWEDREKRWTVDAEMQLIGRRHDAAIWVIKKDGDWYSAVDPINSQWEGQFIPEDGDKDFALAIEEVFQGAQILKYNFFDKIYTNLEVMTVGTPWITKDGEIVGAIFMHTPTSGITETVNDMIQNVSMVTAIAVVLSVIMISIMAHRFAQPLVEMNRIVKSYAKGDFSKRAKVKSGDEIGQLSQAVNAMAVDLEGLETMRRSFVANVSHELKSPLSSMRGFLQAILDGSVPQAESREYLQIVFDETLRLNELINDLLDLSKTESGDFPLNISRFDINELIARTLITFEKRIEEKDLNVNVMFYQERCFVSADSDRIAQVLRNLIDNAIKYSQPGADLLIATTAPFHSHKVRVEVRDSGIGIPDEDLPHIWERFYKVEKAHTPGSESSGLGLSIVKRILDQHGSEIEVFSTFGQGTAFAFSLKADEQLSEKPK